jgi:hypothetical protein
MKYQIKAAVKTLGFHRYLNFLNVKVAHLEFCITLMIKVTGYSLYPAQITEAEAVTEMS